MHHIRNRDAGFASLHFCSHRMLAYVCVSSSPSIALYYVIQVHLLELGLLKVGSGSTTSHNTGLNKLLYSLTATSAGGEGGSSSLKLLYYTYSALSRYRKPAKHSRSQHVSYESITDAATSPLAASLPLPLSYRHRHRLSPWKAAGPR